MAVAVQHVAEVSFIPQPLQDNWPGLVLLTVCCYDLANFWYGVRFVV